MKLISLDIYQLKKLELVRVFPTSTFVLIGLKQ